MAATSDCRVRPVSNLDPSSDPAGEHADLFADVASIIDAEADRMTGPVISGPATRDGDAFTLDVPDDLADVVAVVIEGLAAKVADPDDPSAAAFPLFPDDPVVEATVDTSAVIAGRVEGLAVFSRILTGVRVDHVTWWQGLRGANDVRMHLARKAEITDDPSAIFEAAAQGRASVDEVLFVVTSLIVSSMTEVAV